MQIKKKIKNKFGPIKNPQFEQKGTTAGLRRLLRTHEANEQIYLIGMQYLIL